MTGDLDLISRERTKQAMELQCLALEVCGFREFASRVRTMLALIDFVPAAAQHHSRAMADVFAERQRQIDVEGWTPAHDDAHTKGELAQAAACYAVLAGEGARANENDKPGWWPWDWRWWKSTTRRRDLVKACALLVAEIERLDRAAIGGGNG